MLLVQKLNLKKITLFLQYLFIVLLFFMLIPSFSKAALFDTTPEIVGKLNSAFEEIEKWLLRLSTPAAAVAIAVGFFMQKFSFGDEERIRTAKKLIRTSLFSYGFILVLDLILAAIKSLLS